MLKTNLKLLVVSDYFYPHWTGISKSIFHLCEQLQNSLNITILTTQSDKNLKQNDTYENLLIKRYMPLFSISRLKYAPQISFLSNKYLREADIILINSPCSHVFPIALQACLLGKKLVIFHQGDLILPKGFSNMLIEKLFGLLTHLALGLADKNSCYSLDYAKHSKILQFHLNKFNAALMPIGVKHLQKPQRVARISELKKKYPILLGFAGRFSEEKGFDLLFEAIPQIIKAIPNLHFLYAGEIKLGYENFFDKHAPLFSEIEDHLTMVGLLDTAQLVYFYQNLDYLFVPSRSDCFNLTQAEAMYLGTPVLSSNIPGLRYMVRETGYGYLFNQSDPQDIVKTTIYALEHKEELSSKHSKVLALLNDIENSTHFLQMLCNYE